MTPTFPNPDTGNSRLLLAMLYTFPNPAWNCDSGLGIKANSRASNLRKMGWPVPEAARRTVIRNGKCVQEWGYYIAAMPVLRPEDVPTFYAWDYGTALMRASGEAA